VVVDERRPQIGDIAMPGDVVEHEVAQVRGVSDGDLDDEVVAAGHDEDRDGFRELGHVLPEPVDRLADLRVQPYVDESLNRAAQ
jgi:hypothetical protein